jgi:hypothetical protein
LIDQSLAHPAYEHVPEGTEDLEHVGSIVPRALRSTRYIRCDYEFLGLLNEDFSIDFFSLNQAFMGVPSAPKKQAISLCEWAIRTADGDAYHLRRQRTPPQRREAGVMRALLAGLAFAGPAWILLLVWPN